MTSDILSILVVASGGGSAPGPMANPVVATFSALGSLGYTTLLMSHLVRWGRDMARGRRDLARDELRKLDDEYRLVRPRQPRDRDGRDITGE